MNFSRRLICFAVASKFYDYFTDRNDGKSMAMVIIIVVFIITLVMGFLMVQWFFLVLNEVLHLFITFFWLNHKHFTSIGAIEVFAF